MLDVTTSILTWASDWQAIASAELDDAEFPALEPTSSEPADDGVVEALWGPDSHRVGRGVLRLIFFGSDAAGETFSARLTGWQRTTQGLFVPVPLAEFSVTLGALAGLAGYTPDAEQYFATTVTQTDGTERCEIISPGDSRPAIVLLDAFASQYLQLTVQLATAAGGNALFSLAS